MLFWLLVRRFERMNLFDYACQVSNCFPHRKQELCRRINVMRICFHVLVTVSYICILRLCFCPRHLDCVVTRCASVREFICYMCVMTYLCTIIHVVDSILYGHSFHDQKKNSSAYLPFCDHFVF